MKNIPIALAVLLGIGIIVVGTRFLLTPEASAADYGVPVAPEGDIDRMMREAEQYAEEDRKRKEEAEVRNQADTLVYQTDKLLSEQGEKFEGDEKQKVTDALAALREALGGSDVEAIKSATEALLTASQSFSQRLYEEASKADAASTGSAGSGGGAEEPSDDEVVDAEIVDEKE